jgi:hypothetical protein
LLAYIDSNVFFCAKILDAKYGEACVSIVKDIAKAKLKAAISVLVILEVANTLRKYGLRDEIKNEVDALYSLNMVVNEVDSAIIRGAIDLSYKTGISPYDCVHAVTMKELGISRIISADKDFDKIGLGRIDPNDY